MTVELVATLVAGQGTTLLASLLQGLLRSVEVAGGSDVRIGWLTDDKAADLFCRNFPADRLHNLLGEALQGQAVDVIVQPSAMRQKKILIADMESTIIEQEMLDELADVIGLRSKVAEITRRAMNGELDFAAALKERVGLLKGQNASILDDVAQRITLMPGAGALIAMMKKANDATCWLVSGGFTCFVAPVARQLGFDEAYANVLVVRDGIITGDVIEPVLDKNTKRALLEQACKELGFDLSNAVAVGDGANDVPMLAACNEGGGLGVAYHAKPNVRAVIPNQINAGDLTTLLYAQGYSCRSSDDPSTP